MKTIKELREAKTYDISDWGEDGIDDLINMEFTMAGLKGGKDYEIKYKGNKVTLIMKNKKAEKAVAHLFKQRICCSSSAVRINQHEYLFPLKVQFFHVDF